MTYSKTEQESHTTAAAEALTEVRKHHPEVCGFVLYPNGHWLFTDCEGDAPTTFSPAINMEVITRSTDSLPVPFIYFPDCTHMN